MTSEEIKNSLLEKFPANQIDTAFSVDQCTGWLREIAYQLAVMNEDRRENRGLIASGFVKLMEAIQSTLRELKR